MTKNNTTNIKTVSDFDKAVLALEGSFAYRGESEETWYAFPRKAWERGEMTL